MFLGVTALLTCSYDRGKIVRNRSRRHFLHLATIMFLGFVCNCMGIGVYFEFSFHDIMNIMIGM